MHQNMYPNLLRTIYAPAAPKSDPRRLLALCLTAFCFTTCLTAGSATAETLADIYELALTNDPQVRAAEASYRMGKESLPHARAGLLPTLSASAAYHDGDGIRGNSRTLGSSFIAQSVGDYDDESESYAVSLTQPLFDLPAWFTFKRGQDLSQQAAAQFAKEQQDTIIRVADTYFGVLRASENLSASQAEERAIGRQLEQTKERFNVGLLPITDVHEAQAAYDSAAVNTLEARSALDIAFQGLQILTGKQHTALAGLVADFPVTKPEPLEQDAWVTFAQANNFALQAARLSMAAAEKNAQSKKSEHLPKITASIDYIKTYNDGVFQRDGGLDPNPPFGYEDPARQPFTADEEATVFTLRLDAPLYSGGRVSSQRRLASQEYILARENHLLAQRRTTQQAREQHLRVLTDAARVTARRQAITSAQSAETATQVGYEVGTRNIVDVLIAQRTLYQAQRDYANARYDYVSNMLRLKEVAGQLSPGDIAQLERWLSPELKVERATQSVVADEAKHRD